MMKRLKMSNAEMLQRFNSLDEETQKEVIAFTDFLMRKYGYDKQKGADTTLAKSSVEKEKTK
jgi:hypothetical protein